MDQMRRLWRIEKRRWLRRMDKMKRMWRMENMRSLRTIEKIRMRRWELRDEGQGGGCG